MAERRAWRAAVLDAVTRDDAAALAALEKQGLGLQSPQSLSEVLVGLDRRSLAAEAGSAGSVAALRFLLETARLDPNQWAADGTPPLLHALRTGPHTQSPPILRPGARRVREATLRETVQLFVAAGASLSATDRVRS